MCCLFLVVYLVILSEGRDVFYKEKTSGPLADVQFEGKSLDDLAKLIRGQIAR
jgi:hypothetical protein